MVDSPARTAEADAKKVAATTEKRILIVEFVFFGVVKKA
jgi:hypothetical protein